MAEVTGGSGIACSGETGPWSGDADIAESCEGVMASMNPGAGRADDSHSMVEMMIADAKAFVD
jgi:hypothetical protein